MTPADTAPLRACGHCTAAKNVTGMVIIRARPCDYLCLRHQQWLRGPAAPLQACLAQLTGKHAISRAGKAKLTETSQMPAVSIDLACSRQQEPCTSTVPRGNLDS